MLRRHFSRRICRRLLSWRILRRHFCGGCVAAYFPGGCFAAYFRGGCVAAYFPGGCFAAYFCGGFATAYVRVDASTPIFLGGCFFMPCFTPPRGGSPTFRFSALDLRVDSVHIDRIYT
jgi:hypothetical protein